MKFTVPRCVTMTDAEIGALSTADLIEVYNLMAPFASKETVERFPTRPIGVTWTCDLARLLRQYRTADGLRPFNAKDLTEEVISHPTAKLVRRGRGRGQRTVILDDPRFIEGGIDPGDIIVAATPRPPPRVIPEQERKVIAAELLLAKTDVKYKQRRVNKPDTFTNRCRELIQGGFDDETIWLTLQHRFRIADDKRRWQVAWHREQMKRGDADG